MGTVQQESILVEPSEAPAPRYGQLDLEHGVVRVHGGTSGPSYRPR